MGRMALPLLLLCCLLSLALGSDQRMAECKFGGALAGTVRIHFTNDQKEATMFMGTITKLTPGSHGFHVHEVCRGRRILEIGQWTLDIGHWKVDVGQRTLKSGRRTVDVGHWTLDFKHWT